VDELYGQMVDALVKFTTIRRQVLTMLPNLQSTQETLQKETFDTLKHAIAIISDPQQDLLPNTEEAVRRLDLDQLKDILLASSHDVKQVNGTHFYSFLSIRHGSIVKCVFTFR
jgi:hypothetical protein